MKKEFLDLGRQPIANKFLKEDEFKDEFFFDLKVVFDENTKLLSMKEFVKPELMFNDEYAYNTSLSTPMIKHFKDYSKWIKEKYFNNVKNIIEIGSNDGTFLKNFKSKKINHIKGYHVLHLYRLVFVLITRDVNLFILMDLVVQHQLK